MGTIFFQITTLTFKIYFVLNYVYVWEYVYTSAVFIEDRWVI